LLVKRTHVAWGAGLLSRFLELQGSVQGVPFHHKLHHRRNGELQNTLGYSTREWVRSLTGSSLDAMEHLVAWAKGDEETATVSLCDEATTEWSFPE
jgi:hypothetical protein